MSRRCRCGRFTSGALCERCWRRKVESLRIRIHAAQERAGICQGQLCVWWL
jgi:hypothetical protein